MKKKVVLCVCSWAVLIGLVIGLYSYASKVGVTMEAPAVVLIERDDGVLTLKWNAVDYATSYRVYRKNVQGGWELLQAVGSKVNSYELPAGSTAEGTYAVRSCNVSMIKTTLSEYSEALVGEG